MDMKWILNGYEMDITWIGQGCDMDMPWICMTQILHGSGDIKH